MVRPTKFTEATVHAILSGIRAGLPYALAAEAAGITYQTLNEWQKGHFPRGADKELKAEFSEALPRARAESARRLTALISSAATSDWRASAWLLERRWPEHYAKDASLLARLDALEASLAGDPNAPTPLRKDVA